MSDSKNTRIIGFGNQKGGTGKSTTTRNLATSVWYDLYLKWEVELWDCDNPQFTNSQRRFEDNNAIETLADLINDGKFMSYKKNMLELSNVFKERNTDLPYPIYSIATPSSYNTSNDSKVMYVNTAIKNSVNKADIVLLDLPGVIASSETIALIPYMDYLMIPIDYDSSVLDSTLSFIDFIITHAESLETIPPFMKNNNIYIFFPKYKKGKTLSHKIETEKIIKDKYPFIKSFKNFIAEAENIKQPELGTMFQLSGLHNEHFNKFYTEFIETVI